MAKVGLAKLSFDRRTALHRTALRQTAENFALFFPSPASIFVLSSLSWGSFRLILVVFLKASTLKCARFKAAALQTPPQFHERKKKERDMWREREKNAKFRPPPLRGPHLCGPPLLPGPHPFHRTVPHPTIHRPIIEITMMITITILFFLETCYG